MGKPNKVKLYERDEKGEFNKLVGTYKNLWVTNGKALTLDILWGLKSWWNPKESYEAGEFYATQERYVGFGTSMFTNDSFERADAIEGIPEGDELDYPVDDTWLVSPEDSFLSSEIGTGTRSLIEAIRRDLVVELSTIVTCPGNIEPDTPIREFASFLAADGPSGDPALYEDQKPKSMICRSVIAGTGWFNESGACEPQDEGATMCYFDQPYVATQDLLIVWEFTEI